MGLRATGVGSRVALAFESDWGTPPNSGYHQLGFDKLTLGSVSPLQKNQTLGLGFGREGNRVRMGETTCDGQITVPVDVNDFGIWLKLLFGPPVTTPGSGAYFTHVFRTGVAAPPSATIEVAHLRVPAYFMNRGVVGQSLQITIDPKTERPVAVINLLGIDEDESGTSSIGTPTLNPELRFSNYAASVSNGGTALGNVLTTAFTVTNNWTGERYVGSGRVIGSADPGGVEGSGSAKIRFQDTGLLTSVAAGLPLDLSYQWTIDSNHALSVEFPEVLFSKPKFQIDGPAGISGDFNWIAQGRTTNTAAFTLKNEIASY